ncbi:MAG: hypothetical protein R3B57_14765 [Phycisphaerales bacterium]
MHARITSVLALALALCVSVAAGQRVEVQTGPRDAAVDTGGIVYRLAPDSVYSEGCVGIDPPCDCLVIEGDAFRGAFVLAPMPRQAIADPIRRWAVRDVNWLATINGEEREIFGGGVLEIGSPGPTPVVQIRMRLHLSIDGMPPTPFDSGWAPIEQFGTLVIDLLPADSGECFGQAFHLIARPVPVGEIIPYALRPGSVFREGCYDPCDCLLTEVDVRGAFGLVRLSPAAASIEGLYEEWALVRIHWRSVEDAITDPPFIVGDGSGMYRINLAAAAPVPPHRLTLDLRLNRGDPRPVHFDSGWVSQTVGIGSNPPVIVIEAAQNGFVCFDRVWAIDAAPTP